MENPIGIVIISMLLNLPQAKQNLMINWILTGKAIALAGNNTENETKQKVLKKSYTHIFTGPKIVLIEKLNAKIEKIKTKIPNHIHYLIWSSIWRNTKCF